MKTIVLIFLFLSISACSTTRQRWMEGTVALKLNNEAGIACVESEEVKVGQKLILMNTDCTQEVFPDVKPACKLIPAGELEVTKLVNPHYVEFRKVSGAGFKEGSIVKFP